MSIWLHTVHNIHTSITNIIYIFPHNISARSHIHKTNFISIMILRSSLEVNDLLMEIL